MSEREPNIFDLLRLEREAVPMMLEPTPLSQEERERLVTLKKACGNAILPMLSGIGAVGRLLAEVGGNKGAAENLGSEALFDTGWLLASLAETVAILRTNESDIRCRLELADEAEAIAAQRAAKPKATARSARIPHEPANIAAIGGSQA